MRLVAVRAHGSWETVEITSKGKGKNKGRWVYNYACRIESKSRGQEAASDRIWDRLIDTCVSTLLKKGI